MESEQLVAAAAAAAAAATATEHPPPPPPHPPPPLPHPPPVDAKADACSEQERRKKKPYKELTLHEKVQLIRLAEENSGMSQAAIAERYTIAKSNVCRILQRKKEYLMAYETAGYAGSRKRKLKSAATTDIIDSRPMGGGGGGGGLLVPADVSRSDGKRHCNLCSFLF